MTVLRDLPRFRFLWLSKAISSTGTGIGRIALVLFASAYGPGAVSLMLICVALPLVAGPLAGAVADRVDQRRLLAGCDAGQAVVYATMAIARPPLGVLLLLAVTASVLATLSSPAGKSAVRDLVPPHQRGQANALLSLAMNVNVVAGAAIGGLLTGTAGVSAAFGVNAGSFALSALLLVGLGSLGSSRDEQPGLWADTLSGLRYAKDDPLLRGLVLGVFVFITFASVDNVALVFFVRQTLHGSATEYGLVSASFGVGMMFASVALSFMANQRPAAFWLIGGAVAGAVGTVLTGIAPSAGVALVGQALAGAGNTADLVGIDTLIQERVAPQMVARAFGTVYGAAQLAGALSYVLAGPLVTLTDPRTTFVIAGAGALTGAAVLAYALVSPITRREPGNKT